MIAGTRLGIALLVIALGMAACGGDADGAGPADTQATTTTAGSQDTTTSQPAEAELTRATFASGATVDHPADWASYGAGFSGSLELVIPQTTGQSCDIASRGGIPNPSYNEG
jgi:hypothetical protein